MTHKHQKEEVSFSFLPLDSTELVETIQFYQRSFSLITILWCDRLLLYTRLPITISGGKCQNISLGNFLKTQTAETHASHFRTLATTTPRAYHIHNRRDTLHIERFCWNFFFHPFTYLPNWTSHILKYTFMMSSMHWFMLSTLVVFQALKLDSRQNSGTHHFCFHGCTNLQ